MGFEYCLRIGSFRLIIPIVAAIKEYPRAEDYDVHGIHDFLLGDRVASIGGILLDGAVSRNEVLTYQACIPRLVELCLVYF